MHPVVRAALSGAATGGRTFTGLAAVTAATPPATTQPDRFLRRPLVAVPVGLLAVTELVMDKLPQTPSRLDPPGLVPRVLIAAGCGVVIARRAWRRPARRELTDETSPAEPARDPRLALACAATAATAAVGTAWLGVRWRDVAARSLGPAWVGAVIEDAAVLALAAGSVN